MNQCMADQYRNHHRSIDYMIDGKDMTDRVEHTITFLYHA